jgi:hypothetical protein
MVSLTDKINPIDNTTVITSLSFISICMALIVFIKKFPPINPTLTNISLIILSATATLFGISALISYIDIARISCQKIEEVFSVKFIAYLFGIALFGISAMLVIYPY